MVLSVILIILYYNTGMPLNIQSRCMNIDTLTDPNFYAWLLS